MPEWRNCAWRGCTDTATVVAKFTDPSERLPYCDEHVYDALDGKQQVRTVPYKPEKHNEKLTE